MIYLAFTALAIVAAGFVAAPLARRQGASEDARRAVFRRQIAEIDRDEANGVVAADEAEALRREAQRRLIAAAGAVEVAAPSAPRPAAAMLLAMLAVMLAGGFYATRGRPAMPGVSPLAGEPSADDIASRIAAHLALNPDDGPAHSAYGEALAFAAGGEVTPQALAAFRRAHEIDGADVRALFFLGLERDRAGDAAGALAFWKPLAERAPADATWAEGLRARLAELEGEAAMSDEDRSAMIDAMVERLAARLRDAPNDPDGWARLVASYRVMGRASDADAAMAAARGALDGEALAAFESAVSPQ